jgi:pimeloyl-ACP methyl ester carboxylesterase
MRTVSVGSGAVAYLDSGEAEGKAVIFIHGSGGTSFSFTSVFAGLKGKMRMIIPDLPGHGESGGPPPNSIGGYSEWLRSFLTEIGVSDFMVAGHSMGGAIAQHLAIDNPPGLRGIVLISTGAKLKVHPKIFERLTDDFEDFCRWLSGMVVGKNAPVELKEEILKQLMMTDTSVFLNDFKCCDEFDIRERLGEIDVPALIIAGTEDGLTPLYYAEYLAQHIRNAALKIIDNAGHSSMLEAPGRVNGAVLEFVATH